MKTAKFRMPYSHKRVAFVQTQPSMTKQNHKDECDINFILKRYIKTGVLEHANTFAGEYGDFAAINFQDAMNTVIESQNMFMTLPAVIRKRFDNDPHQFITYATDEKNRAEMEQLGLAIPRAAPVIKNDDLNDENKDGVAAG